MRIGNRTIRLRPGAWAVLPILVFAFISPANAAVNNPPSYYPAGQAEDVNISTVLEGGWELCYSNLYGDTVAFSAITNACDEEYIMVAGGPTNGTTLDLLAVSPRTEVFTETPGQSICSESTTTAHLSNGSYWYLNGWSFGFSPNQTIHQCSADTYDAWSGTTGAQRMSWHTNGDQQNRSIMGGWRLGEKVGLNGSTEYTRYVFQSAGVAPATSLVVTSNMDDGSLGTLRWAINQANAQSGGIYDAITFADGLSGVILLTSDLPAITAGVSITGNGMAVTYVDGNNLYRPIYNNGSRTIVIQDMTFKQGKNVSWNGGLIYNGNGTMTFNRIKISDHPSWAFYQGGGGVTTFNNSQFTNNGYAITSDHGSTPSVLSLTDSNYANRIYVNDSTFTSNTYGVRTERFVKINNSQFIGNTQTGAYLGGLNRQQVSNSVFTSNGTGVYLFSYIPAGWTPGAGNQLVEGNTFTGNSVAINFNNYFNNGIKTYNGVHANSWSTSKNNTFDDNVNIYSGDGFVQENNTVVTTTTTSTTTTSSTTSTSIVPTTTTSTTIVSPINNTTTTEPEVVPPPIETIPTDNTTVSIPELDPTPVSTPELETTVTTISPTTTTLIETIFDTPVEVTPVETPASEGNSEGDGPAASVPQYAPEQETTTQTDEPPIVVPEAVQDAADAAVEDIFDGPMSNAGIANAVDDLVADAETPEQLTAVVNSLLDQELSDTQFATVIESVFDGPMSNENFAAAVDAVFEDPTQLSDAQFEDAVTAVFDGPLSDAQFEDAIAAVFEDTKSLSDEQFDAAVQAVFDEPLTTEQFTEALSAVFDEPITDEKFDAIIDAVLDEPLTGEQFEELVNVLESETVTEEQVAAAVDSVIENGVTEDQAVDLATSEKVLQSVDGDQAAEIFDAVEITNVTPEDAVQLVNAVQDAPVEVKESFEAEINIFEGPVDTYVPLGSSIPVSGRRVIIGIGTAVLFSVPPTVRRK